MQRIGIFSGAFDPVHIGHLRAAQACLGFLSLDEVLFVPFGRPLIRQAEAEARHRAALITLSIAAYPGMRLSKVDLVEEPRYAVDTLGEMKKRYPDAQLYYIVGADKLADIPHWKEASRLYGLCEFAAFPRAGYDTKALCEALRAQGATVHLVPSELITMSSSQIRAQLRLLSDAPGRLLPQAAAYIASLGLYLPDYARMVRQAVSPQRFRHTLGVRKTAVRLARLHGLPMQKAGVAGILHDCAKNMELGRLQAIARQTGLVVDEATFQNNALLHGLVGAQVARLRYHVRDTQILDAIRYHTTGRAGMEGVELVLFVADAIEPQRDYPGVELVRAQAEQDLRLAALTSLTGTRKYVKTKGMVYSELSTQAIEDLRARLRRVPPAVLKG